MLVDKPIPYDEAVQLLRARFGHANIKQAIENLDRLLAYCQSKHTSKRSPSLLRERESRECVECGDTAHQRVGDAALCQDCYDAM